jgi:hypothetical protein
MHHNSDLTRRQLISRLALTALGVGLPSAPHLFAASEPKVLQNPKPTAKNIIYLFFSGGMSQIDTLDPKPGRTEMGSTKAISSKLDGCQVGSHFSRVAQTLDRWTLVRSMTTKQGDHAAAINVTRTCYPLTSTIRHPVLGAWMSLFHGKGNENLPALAYIGGESSYTGGGFLASPHQPIVIGDPTSGLRNSQFGPKTTIERFEQRRGLARVMDARFETAHTEAPARSYNEVYDQAIRLMRSKDLAAFDITKEDPKTRERYGDNAFGQGCLLARRLVQHGVRFVEVTQGGYDTHNGHFLKTPSLYEAADRAASALLEDVIASGMLKDTIIVWSTEFGRTPVLNANQSRDHNVTAYSCMACGGGFKAGHLHGSSDESATHATEDPVKVEDFHATLAYALGLPLGQIIYSPTSRPFTVSNKGKPVLGLLA